MLLDRLIIINHAKNAYSTVTYETKPPLHISKNTRKCATTQVFTAHRTRPLSSTEVPQKHRISIAKIEKPLKKQNHRNLLSLHIHQVFKSRGNCLCITA